MQKNSKLSSRELSERNHFDSMANLYDRNYTYNTAFTQFKIKRKLLYLFKSYLKFKNKKLKILEIGAGTGEYTSHLAQLFPRSEIHALDISPKILKVAKTKCADCSNIIYDVASVYNLPFKDNSFDIVCGFYILHHLDINVAMKDISRVLKDNGSALFYEPNFLNPIVFLIKMIPSFKKMVGDSPEEMAVNPFSLRKYAALFKSIDYSTSEFVAIPNFIPYKLSRVLDFYGSRAGSLPLLNQFGGSVAIKLIK